MAVEWDDLPRPNLLTWVAEVEQSVQARALPERVRELGEWLDHRLPRPRGPRQFVARPCDASGVVGRLRKGPMRPGPRREGAHGRRSCQKKLFVCRLTCLPQVCQGKRHGFERMQKVADDTTQHCHRLAVTQPACPTLAPPPPPPPGILSRRGLTNGGAPPDCLFRPCSQSPLHLGMAVPHLRRA